MCAFFTDYLQRVKYWFFNILFQKKYHHIYHHELSHPLGQGQPATTKNVMVGCVAGCPNPEGWIGNVMAIAWWLREWLWILNFIKYFFVKVNENNFFLNVDFVFMKFLFPNQNYIRQTLFFYERNELYIKKAASKRFTFQCRRYIIENYQFRDWIALKH